jgi:HEAT repeat protein
MNSVPLVYDENYQRGSVAARQVPSSANLLGDGRITFRRDFMMSFLNRLLGSSKSTGSKSGKLPSGHLSEESSPRKQAINTMRPSSGYEMDKAIEVLHNDQSWEMRRNAAKVLANYSGNSTFDALVDAMKHDGSRVVRFVAADALGGFGEVAVESLITALDDKEKSVVESAAKSLGRIRSERAMDPLIKTLSYKSDYAPVCAAREALIEFGSVVVPLLLSHIGDADIHAEVVDALAAIGDIRVSEVLLTVAKDATEKINTRVRAVRGLGQMPAFDCISALLELLSDTNDIKLVDVLLESLKKLLPGVDINAATRKAKKRSLEKYLADLKSIAPGMPEKVAERLSGGHSFFKLGANIVCNTKFGEFQLIVGGDQRVIRTSMLENVLNKVETALKDLE